MLHDRVEELFAQHGLGDEALVDLHLYLTVTRSDLLKYFQEHPGAADAYLASHTREADDAGDEIVLQKNEIGYAVWANDRGTPRHVRTFENANEAVAEYLLAITGRLTHGDR